jgi:hypothetical protein
MHCLGIEIGTEASTCYLRSDRIPFEKYSSIHGIPAFFHSLSQKYFLFSDYKHLSDQHRHFSTMVVMIKTPCPQSVNVLYRLSDRRLSAKLMPTFMDKKEITAAGIRRTDHATPLCPQKLAVSLPTSGGRSVGVVRPRTQATECVCVCLLLCKISGNRQSPKFQ